jgi:NitT/TauT family transport system substrate-binding protein
MTTDPTAAQLLSTGKAQVLLDMRTEAGVKAALGGLYPASSLYMDCAWVAAHKPTVRKLATALVKTLHWIKGHSTEEIAAKMPPEYAAGGKDLYVKAVHDSIGMFNGDGVMKTDGARNVLEVLSQLSPNVQGKKDSIDLTKTYTTKIYKLGRISRGRGLVRSALAGATGVGIGRRHGRRHWPAPRGRAGQAVRRRRGRE